jgi:carbon-monoxide dehydrogenase medium subunit
MGARVLLEGPGGSRELALEDFFKGPGMTCMEKTEIMKEIIIPPLQTRTGSCFLKTGRLLQDIAVVNAAALISVESGRCRTCRIAVGAVAPTPLRLRKVEALLEGEEVSPDLLEEAAKKVEEEVHPISDIRSTQHYRRIVSGVLVRRALERALETLM